MNDPDNIKEKFVSLIHTLQDEICMELEKYEPVERFREDAWQRDGGGGGRSRVIANGKVFEKAGVNSSVVHGVLPDTMRKQFETDHNQFFACGISLVIHPLNPHVPTVHANYRYFELYDNQRNVADSWFGGGSDLTPFYLYPEDIKHFHACLKKACDMVDNTFYQKFKHECDDYFFIRHRGESRGVGGIFYDYLRPDEHHGKEHCLSLAKNCGEALLKGYQPIIEKRKDASYGDTERQWQLYRRGRYAEFNLVQDRGTLFGLKTNGRVESILMSLPPLARWEYDYHPAPGSREADLQQVLKKPMSWI
jgi:coproporphyrinogen III oxidase